MSDTTGTPEDAERAWQAWSADTFEYDGTIAHQAFLAGLAARPSVTVDEITELLAGHEARWTTFGDARPYDVIHCQGYWNHGCQWKLRNKALMSAEDCYDAHRAHLASVIVAHITGEGANDD